MKAEDRYLKFVLWSDDDRAYVGYCPDLFSWGGVCHGVTEESTYRVLCRLVHEEVVQLHKGRRALPPSSTRPMRDAVLA